MITNFNQKYVHMDRLYLTSILPVAELGQARVGLNLVLQDSPEDSCMFLHMLSIKEGKLITIEYIGQDKETVSNAQTIMLNAII